MPTPIEVTAAQLDLSGRIAETAAVLASPALAAETIVAQLTLDTNLAILQGVLLRGFLAFTVGTSGVNARVRIRRTNVAGAVVSDTGALTGGIAAAGVVAESILGFDTGVPGTGQVYVLTLQVGSASAASTVSAVEFDAIVV